MAAIVWTLTNAGPGGYSGVRVGIHKLVSSSRLRICCGRRRVDEPRVRHLVTTWLHKWYLNNMEFMPNENCIVLRRVGSTAVHEKSINQMPV